jgi:hypothetical protein
LSVPAATSTKDPPVRGVSVAPQARGSSRAPVRQDMDYDLASEDEGALPPRGAASAFGKGHGGGGHDHSGGAAGSGLVQPTPARGDRWERGKSMGRDMESGGRDRDRDRDRDRSRNPSRAPGHGHSKVPGRGKAVLGGT